MEYNLLYRWFVGLDLEETVWDATSPAGPGGIKKVKLRGMAKVHSLFTFALAAYNLVRMRTLLMPQVQSI